MEESEQTRPVFVRRSSNYGVAGGGGQVRERSYTDESEKGGDQSGNRSEGMYVAEVRLSKGHRVHDIKRRMSLFNTEEINHLK